MDYPIWNLAIGGGVLIGIVAITHVLVSHFAVGGGIAIAFVETLAVRRGDPALRALAKRSSLMLILVSTVFGAISGVGIWVTIGLVQPAATSALIHNYVWGWAAEWGFFILEVATALAYYATWEKVRPRTHLLIIWLYFFAAYMSLVDHPGDHLVHAHAGAVARDPLVLGRHPQPDLPAGAACCAPASACSSPAPT